MKSTKLFQYFGRARVMPKVASWWIVVSLSWKNPKVYYLGPKWIKIVNSFEVICETMKLLTTTTIVKYVVVRLNNYLSGATIVDEIVKKNLIQDFNLCLDIKIY